MTQHYGRTPLPRSRTPRGAFALCWLLLIASPFLGVALHGRMEERGWVSGLPIALLALAGLIVLTLRRRREWRALPAALREEWTRGRLVPAEGAPALMAPVRFAQKGRWIELRDEGVAFSRDGLLAMQGVPRALQVAWVLDQAGQWFVPWSDIVEWEVDTDSDGPDFYRLALRQGALRVCRMQPEEGTECDVLDAVRSIGGRPVRLRCDVAC